MLLLIYKDKTDLLCLAQIIDVFWGGNNDKLDIFDSFNKKKKA